MGLWQEPNIGLIGRDRLITRHLRPANNTQEHILIQGKRNVGLSAVLQFLHGLQTKRQKALINGGETNSANLKAILTQWACLGPNEKMPGNVTDLKTRILQESGHALYVDDLHNTPPQVLIFLKNLSAHHKIVGAIHNDVPMSGPKAANFQDLARNMNSFRIRPLSDPLELAEKLCLHFGSNLSPRDVGDAGMGMPGLMAPMCQTGRIQRAPERTSGEEIDESILLIIAPICWMAARYYGRIADDPATQLAGGVGGIVLLGLGRLLWSAGKK